MRKILFVLLLFKCYVSFSQEKFTVFFRNAVNEKVKVFFSENSHEECAEIKEDSLLENWHNVKILQKSACRYLVEIKNEQHPDLLLIKGWVKKTDCGIYLRGKYLSEGKFCVNIYKSPNDAKSPTVIIGDYPDSFPCKEKPAALPVLDFLYDGTGFWVKTSFYGTDGTLIEGWTKDISSSIY
ncbi:hypothetical protein SAMN05216518_102104 [Bacteroidales bacterium KHT7]|jgi:hypothetical protein|nr:hypothetical protein SAMN05216518_102104 [Bacteroidales bacterium KHT7]